MYILDAIDEGFKKTLQTMMMYPVDPVSLPEEDLEATEPQVASTKPNQGDERKLADLSLSVSEMGETLSASFSSENPTVDDGSFAMAEALSVGGAAEQRAWYYLPDKIQEKLESLTPGQRQRACRMVTVVVIAFLIAYTSIALSSRRGSVSSSSSIHDDNMTPHFNGTISETTPTSSLPLRTAEPSMEPTRWYDDMATLLRQPSQPPINAPPSEAPSSKTIAEATNWQNSGTYIMTTPPNDTWHEGNSTTYPTILLDAGTLVVVPPPDYPPSPIDEPDSTTITPAGTSQPNVDSTMPPDLQTSQPTPPATSYNTTYIPGLLNHLQHGLLLSNGLQARLIATSGQPVQYSNGQSSSIPFHYRPDGGATFEDTRPDSDNFGGWVYVSNSEMRLEDPPYGLGNGGVGAITFDKEGQIIKYEMILTNTTWNCAGGKTPWNTWVSCEELESSGQIYQVSPFGLREPEVLTLGKSGGRFEAFAYDIQNPSEPHFFVTEDHERGALQRFTPDDPDWTNDPWSMLHGNGTTEYLVLKPTKKNGGTFRWTDDEELAKNSARKYYPNTEGIDSHGSKLFFVSKTSKQLYELDLDDMTYTNASTEAGLFDGTPDQMQRVNSDNDEQHPDVSVLYFSEEAGKDSGVHGRTPEGDYFTVLESPVYSKEVTGMAFSPDGLRLYLAYQTEGVLFEVTREDGEAFHADALNLRYHSERT